MDEGVKTNGSYAWQSILKAHQVVDMGSYWRIGDGRSVLIRGDKWLPGLHHSKVLSPQNHFPMNTKVCALMNENGTSWDVDRVRGEFLPFEANEILSIPLSSRRPVDRRIWKETKNGVYSTKSANRLLAKTAKSNQPGTSNPTVLNSFWNNIWKLNIPNKVKHFLWRACSKSLPTKRNLVQRRILTNATCDLCRDQPEDAIHALWDCYGVKEIWWKEEVCKPFLIERFVNFQDLFLGILKAHDPYLAERFAFIAWSIWYKRNAVRTGSPSLPYSMIHTEALERLQEFQRVQETPTAPSQVAEPICWYPPSNSWCKANFHGAVFQELGEAGLGVVVRDHEGTVIGALSERIALPPTVEEVEAMAARRAISFAKELDLPKVIFEGDAAGIIDFLNSEEDCLAPFGHIIEESRYLGASFSAFAFSHVKRLGNRVADKLAKLARESLAPRCWLNGIHSDAINLVLSDKSCG